MLEIHSTAVVSPLADLECSSRGSRIVIGPGSRVDSFVKIKPAGGTGDLIVGSNSYVNSGVVIYTGNGVSIGNDVMVAANTTFAPVNHSFSSRDLPIRLQGFQSSRGGIVVEDDVWIGANCVLLDGAILREGCVIAAGSVVRGEMPAFSICMGVPAAPVRQRP